MPALRVVTANLLHGVTLASRGVDLEAHAALLAGLDADVVGLQEVDRLLPRSAGTDQVAVLADRLGVAGAFAPALAGDPDRSWTPIAGGDPGGPAYGVGLLSRHGLDDVRRTPLPGGGPGRRADAAGSDALPRRPPSPGWDREPRVALSATVAAGSTALRVTTTHLSYLPWRGVVQLRHALDAAAGGAAGPAVLCGDLNLPTWVVRSLARPWRHAGGGPTYPAWRPRTQPDQVLVGPAVRLGGVEVVPGPGDHHVLVATVLVP